MALDDQPPPETAASDGSEAFKATEGKQSIHDSVVRLRRLMKGVRRRVEVIENGKPNVLNVTLRSYGPLKCWGERFHLYRFQIDDEWRDYHVVVRADINIETLLPNFAEQGVFFLRVDSGCATGQIFHDATCECATQLHMAVNMLAHRAEGAIIHIPAQDGRGMGQDFKIATLALQDWHDLDTIEAATLLSIDGIIDKRSYAGAIAILKFINLPVCRAIQFATNNPLKEGVFAENGYNITQFISVVAPRTELNERNMEAKKRIGHRL